MSAIAAHARAVSAGTTATTKTPIPTPPRKRALGERCSECGAVDSRLAVDPHNDLHAEWQRLEQVADVSGRSEDRKAAERARWAYRAAVERGAVHRSCGGRIERFPLSAMQALRVRPADKRATDRALYQLRSRAPEYERRVLSDSEYELLTKAK